MGAWRALPPSKQKSVHKLTEQTRRQQGSSKILWKAASQSSACEQISVGTSQTFDGVSRFVFRRVSGLLDSGEDEVREQLADARTRSLGQLEGVAQLVDGVRVARAWRGWRRRVDADSMNLGVASWQLKNKKSFKSYENTTKSLFRLIETYPILKKCK